MECSSTLLPGSYKLVGDAGSLVCTHHFTRISSNSQNGRPDLSKQLSPLLSNSSPESTPSGESLENALPECSDSNEHITPSDDLPKTHSLERETSQNKKGGKEIREEFEDGVKVQIEPCPPSPPNPFDESDEEELKEEEQPEAATEVANGDLPVTSTRSTTEENLPVPAPRKVSDSSPPVRPVPRPRPPRPLQSPAVSGRCFRCVTVKPLGFVFFFFCLVVVDFIFSLCVPSLPNYFVFSAFCSTFCISFLLN